jgi:hypothetical protein
MASDGQFVYRGTGERFEPAEYAICQRRGHETNGSGITEGIGPTWTYCRWCGCKFRFTEPECVEHPDDEALFAGLPVDAPQEGK